MKDVKKKKKKHKKLDPQKIFVWFCLFIMLSSIIFSLIVYFI